MSLVTVTQLPSSVALQSSHNSKYLRYVSEKDAARFGYVQFTGEQILSPNVKFEIENASTGNSGLVHIRASYSNKYLRRENSNSYWIVAGADEEEEDQSKWGCTLFEPIQVQAADDNNKLVIRLRHVQLGHYLMLFSPEQSFGSCVAANYATPSSDNSDLFTVTNWGSLVELPKYIALKADNGKYLTPFIFVLNFRSSDIGDELIKFEVFPSGDGSVEIKHYQTGYKLAMGLFADAVTYVPDENLPANPTATLFQPVYVSDKSVVAFKTLYSGASKKFLCRGIDTGFVDTLITEGTSITERAKLVVEEPVLRRDITINYRLDDARIYNLTPITLFTTTEDNHESEEVTKHVTLEYKTSTTTTWQRSLSLSVGLKFSMEVDVVPLIEKDSIEFSTEFSGTREWGGSTTIDTTYTDGGDYQIKPMHKLTVRKLATQGKCNVPYSYEQTDYLMNGEVIGPIQKEDGVYTGVNCFDIYTDSYQVPIDT